MKDCKVMKKCGGCNVHATSYVKTLEAKEESVKTLLGKLAKVSPIVGMDNPYRYRNKVHAAFTHGPKGVVISGIYKEGTHDVVPVSDCLIEDERARKIVATVGELLPSFKLKVYDEDRRDGFLRHVLVKVGKTSGQVMVVLVSGTNMFPSKKNFAKALLEKHPEITTILWNINNKKTSMVLGDKEEVLFGKGYIEDTLCGKTFKISAKSFYQINPVQTEVLYNKAIELLELTGNETVIDAYCGTGTIGIVAAAKAKKVLGIELNETAVKDARENAKNNKVTNISFVCADATKYMVEMATKKEKVDAVIMDPPRAGSTREFMNAVNKLAPSRVVYVSCNPETFARDLDHFRKLGYKASECTPVDMFPWTDSCECVCLLSQRKADEK